VSIDPLQVHNARETSQSFCFLEIRNVPIGRLSLCSNDVGRAVRHIRTLNIQ